jgi:hypothetical protein
VPRASVILVVDDEPVVLEMIARAALRVLLVSGYDPEHTETALPFLRKPFKPVQLVQAVAGLLATPPVLPPSQPGQLPRQ